MAIDLTQSKTKIVADMTYISRKILIKDDDGVEVEFSDTDFFNINANLVLLGEPGAGKSELLRFAAKELDAQFYNASSLGADLEFNDQTRLVIIDGVDEVTAYGTGTPINKILVELPRATRFILSCRAADWQGAINTQIISQKWNKQPKVGQIIPLTEEDIIAFITANGEGQNGQEFLADAQRRDAVDLLRNPQNLLLFLTVVMSEGWPDSRLELYKTASFKLVNEDNETHGSINRDRCADEELIQAAGFVFAQLLLSGKAVVHPDGQSNDEDPVVSELVSANHSKEVIRSVLSTKLFRPTDQNLLEPCHRTVAEFLAAQWIANALKDRLSVRRLQSILYGSNYTVPSALRGLHAWIGTLNSTVAETFIQRDPYGFFRYGDPGALNPQQLKTLYNSLEKLAEDDPYFRTEDWGVSFGRGFARQELLNEFLNIIRNHDLPLLAELIINSIRGDKFSNDIRCDLRNIVIDSSSAYVVRRAAVNAVSECDTESDWRILVEELRKLGDSDSLRIAINVLEDNVTLFSGTTLAELLIAFESANKSRLIGLGYGLHRQLSITQLEESLDTLADFSLEAEEMRGLSDWLYIFLQERFDRSPPPLVSRVCAWMQNSKSYIYYRSNWEKFSGEYFDQNIEYRQELQAEALKSSVNAKDFWLKLFHLGDISSGLWLREDDSILHLNNLLKHKSAYSDWDERWKHLVSWGKSSANYTGKFLEVAIIQASQSKILSSHLAELEKPPERDYEKEDQERERQWEQERQDKERNRHQSFQEQQNELVAGKPLNMLAAIAKAYLGRIYPDITSPTDRVNEHVGDSMTDIALKGITAAITRGDIPTAKQIAELQANEQKNYFLEPILLAHCAIMIEAQGDLTDLPINIVRSALASCHWDLRGGNDFTSSLQERLEQIVFRLKDSKETFVRDTMEPYLNSGAEHVSGLHRLTEDEEFSDIAAPLAIEWIKKYTDLSSNVLRELLFAAIHHGSRDKIENLCPRDSVVKLTREYVFNKSWKDEEQRHIWMGVTFLLDFYDNLNMLEAYAGEDKNHLWALRTFSHPERKICDDWPKLSAGQNYFLITKFGSVWPYADHPSNSWSGNQNPWDASGFIQRIISDLATNLTDEAEVALNRLIGAEGLGYQHHIKHMYAQQTRSRAEANKLLLPITEVRNILLSREPADVEEDIFGFKLKLWVMEVDLKAVWRKFLKLLGK
jgi:hypothetical protein